MIGQTILQRQLEHAGNSSSFSRMLSARNARCPFWYMRDAPFGICAMPLLVYARNRAPPNTPHQSHLATYSRRLWPQWHFDNLMPTTRSQIKFNDKDEEASGFWFSGFCLLQWFCAENMQCADRKWLKPNQLQP